jgi:hypothetical protein
LISDGLSQLIPRSSYADAVCCRDVLKSLTQRRPFGAFFYPLRHVWHSYRPISANHQHSNAEIMSAGDTPGDAQL